MEKRGYVPSQAWKRAISDEKERIQAMNEHPSAWPDFDRSCWREDPFYGWRTKGDAPKAAKLPDEPATVPEVPEEPPRTWGQWLFGWFQHLEWF